MSETIVSTAIMQYSGTPSYDHLVITTIFFRPKRKKITESFYYYEDPVNTTTLVLRPGFYGPTVVALKRFHCTSNHFIPSLTWPNMQIKIFFSSIYCAFCYSLWRLLFYRRKKGGKKEVSNNKLFQILGPVYTSLQNRCFMSQARKTRHFGRSVRRGEEKNKAAVTSPLFWLL